MSKMQVGRKQYRSMRGKPVDMELLRKKNELTPAVGNARTNARGDLLGPGGKIIKKREDVIREYYDNNPNAVKPGKAGVSGTKSEKKATVTEPLTAEETALLQDDEEWIEDEEGNFVRKGE